MKRILFPTDFSEIANNAFVYALHIANQLGAAITTVHAYDMPILEIEGPIGTTSNAAKAAKETINLVHFENYKSEVPQLRKIAEEQGLDHIEINHAMIEGEVYSGILKIQEEVDADLIITGTGGAGWFKEIFGGSMSGELLENARCPVIAIPKNARFDGKIDRIAFATEFTEEESDLLLSVMDFAKYFDATVECLHVDVAHTHDFTQAMNKWKVGFESFDNLEFEVLKGNSIFYALSNYLEGNRFDIVVMLAHRRNWIEELWNASNVKKMSYQFNTPVMAFHAQK